jgi:uncharacterized protein DUF3800
VAAPRIWWVVPPLCGMSTAAARRRLLWFVKMKAFIDESGKGDPVVFSMAGFIARAEQWQAFDDDWAKILALSPAIDHFHMVDAVAAGEFWRIKLLGAVIRKHRFPAFSVVISMRDYNDLYRGRIGPRLDSPYVLGYFSIIELALEWEIANGIDEPIDFIFDVQKTEGDYLQSIFTPLLESQPSDIRRRFGNHPIHADDKQFPALQAADMMAWCWRRVMDAGNRESDDEFMRGLFDGIKVRRRSWHRKELTEFLETAQQNNMREDRLFRYQFEAASRNRDLIVHQWNQETLLTATPGETVSLLSIPAKGMGRFLLVHTCPRADTPHLHRRSSDECLAASQG